MAEPIVKRLGLTTEAAIKNPAATRCVASLTARKGVQKSITDNNQSNIFCEYQRICGIGNVYTISN